MNRRKIGSLLTAAAMMMQTAGQLPVCAADLSAVPAETLTDFAEDVRALTQGDAGHSFYQALQYDPARGVLEADGEAQNGFCGDLTVRSGRLMICAQQPAKGASGLQTAGWILPYSEEAASQLGYETETADGVLSITNEFQTARLIVKAAGKVDPHGACEAAEGYRDLHILQYASPAEAYAAYQLYQQEPGVQYVQPSHRVFLDTQDCDAQLSGVDTDVYMTWGADLIGTKSFIDEYLTAETLPEVTVAVVDTGINRKPALFEGRILDGVNFSDSGDDTDTDDLYHGTHVTGTICELTGSNVRILPIKSFDNSGSASDEQIYIGIMYALEHNADVLNMSFGGLGVSPLEVEAMTIADENGMICCAAAGNEGDDAGYYYPGSIDSCITVAAVSQEMKRADFSNYGSSLDVAAPGVGIVSYVAAGENLKESKNGTSMATPHVSACCALLRSYDKQMTAKRAENLLRLNAVDLGEPGFDKDTGWGLVCMKHFQWDDGVCAAPAYSVKSGNYGTAQTVEITTAQPDAEIYYTTDGSQPDAAHGIRYTGPVRVTESVRLLAVTVSEGWVDSVPSEAVYTIGGKDIAGAMQIEDGVLVRYSGVREQVNVPESADGVPVTSVAEDAFAGNHFVVQVKLPGSVTEIGARAFAGCSALESISARGVRVLRDEVFSGDEKLKSALFSEAADAVGVRCFCGCTALKSLRFPGVRSVPEECFRECKALTELYLPAADSFGNRACLDCAALTALTVSWPDVRMIGVRSFSGCKAWPGDLCLDALTFLGEAAFEDDRALLRVVLPKAIKKLPLSALAGCTGLRELDLRYITEFAGDSLAVKSVRDDLQAVLSYDKITSVGTNAFSGFRLGDGYETVTFSALEALSFRAFAGAAAGVVSLPQISAIPSYTFAESKIFGVVLENTEVLEPESLQGVCAAVLTDKVTEAAADAVPQNTWIVTKDTIPALENCGELHYCDEPLILRANTKTLSLMLHEYADFRIAACGSALQAQWYRMDGGEAVLLEGETNMTFAPDTGKAGETVYRCVLTDSEGKTEQSDFRAIVSGDRERQTLLPDESLCCGTAAAGFYQLTVPVSGSWQIASSGSAPAAGVLTDENGAFQAGFVRGADHNMYLTAELAADKTYYLEVRGRWAGSYMLRLSVKKAAENRIEDCRLSTSAAASAAYDTGYQPSLTVIGKDGTELQADRDYTLSVTKHNQNYIMEVYGIGDYCGYSAVTVPVLDRIPSDTPVPVHLNGKDDHAVFMFIPKTTDTYYYYATIAPGYAEEQAVYNRRGSYSADACCVNLRTKCTVSSKADADGIIYSENSYSPVSGKSFLESVVLNAGQVYYFTCISDIRSEFSLVVSQQRRDIRDAKVTGISFGEYEPGKACTPKPTVKRNGELLTEGVDYQLIYTDNDVPGDAKVTIEGMGLYTGRLVQEFEIAIGDTPAPAEYIGIDEPVRTSCTDGRITMLWFRTETGSTPNETVRYRVLNERESGGAILYRLYSYHAKSQTLSPVYPMNEASDDYMLVNGTYCIILYRQFAEKAGTTNVSVFRPYSVTDAAMEIGTAVYTGSEVPPPLTFTAADGYVLQYQKDYTVSYPEGNIMFGEVPFTVRATKRTYGSATGTFEIAVKLPADAPELTPGEHTASVTLEDRLAVYRLTPETDMTYLLACEDAPNIVLRVFSPEAEMLEQVYGAGTKAVSFEVPAGETRYIMVKYNGTEREGTIHFRLETDEKMLSACEVTANPVIWTGEAVTPDITLTDGGYVLQEGTDYVQRYIVDDVSLGTATVNYIGKGRYVGMTDVTFPVIAENLLQHPDTETVRFRSETVPDAIPLPLNQLRNLRNTEHKPFLLMSYTAGIDMQLHITVLNSYSKLTLQLYNEAGEYQDSLFFRKNGQTDYDMKQGETCYLLAAATDISGTNQVFDILLTDKSNPGMEWFSDPETGIAFRTDPALHYTEACFIVPNGKPLVLPETIREQPVTVYSPAVFAALGIGDTVIGDPNGPAPVYADLYRYLFLPAADAEQPAEHLTGDLNGDGRLSQADLIAFAAFLAEYTAEGAAPYSFEGMDLNGDGLYAFDDLMLLAKQISEAENAEQPADPPADVPAEPQEPVPPAETGTEQ